MEPRLRVVRRRLAIRTAHGASDRGTARQVCPAVAAVEGDLQRSLGWGCGGCDGEVGFWGDFSRVEGWVGVLAGGAAHGVYFIAVDRGEGGSG